MVAGRKRNSRRRAGSRRRTKRRLRRLRIWILILAFSLVSIVVMVRLIFRMDSQTESQKKEYPKLAAADAAVPEAEEDDSVIIIVDAGHGGTDQGTCSKSVLEKDINLAVAKKLVKKLQQDGVTVLMTREEDVKVGLDDRVKFANDQEADLFVSIHCNYCEDDKSVKGLECYYQENSTGGKALAEDIVRAFDGAETVENRGTRTGDFKVLRETKMPAALVEMGFLSNQSECQMLTDEEYQDLLAQRIADGILGELEFLQ